MFKRSKNRENPIIRSRISHTRKIMFKTIAAKREDSASLYSVLDVSSFTLTSIFCFLTSATRQSPRIYIIAVRNLAGIIFRVALAILFTISFNLYMFFLP